MFKITDNWNCFRYNKKVLNKEKQCLFMFIVIAITEKKT